MSIDQDQASLTYLVVGLGNPGSQYAKTRHNIGFEVLSTIAEQYHFSPGRLFGQAKVAMGRIENSPVILAWPQSYMNNSGQAVGPVQRFYRIALANILVIHDELDFVPGEIRLKRGGGAGGHNGLRSLISHVGADFGRIRVGIGKPHNATLGAGYVLSPFACHEQQTMQEAVATAVKIVQVVIQDGWQKAMNHYNRR